MDYQIALMAFISFILFILTLIVLFHMTAPDKALHWIVSTCLVIGIGEGWYLSRYFGFTELVCWIMLYLLMVVLFVFGVFSAVEASLTFRMLAEIASTGSGGLTPRQLTRRYNREGIVKRRINRLLSSGEIIFKRGAYEKNHVSFYSVREYILVILRQIFPEKHTNALP